MPRLNRTTTASRGRRDQRDWGEVSTPHVPLPEGWREIHDFETAPIALERFLPHPKPSGPCLEGKRVLITQAEDFVGPALMERFRINGAEVCGDAGDLIEPSAAGKLIAAAGHIDVLVVNLVFCNPRIALTATTDRQWAMQFEALVHPLHRLVRAVLPQMIKRRAGKIVVIGSANGLRGSASHCAFAAASGAQLAYVRAAGAEAAPHNVQINAIAQRFVASRMSLPDADLAEPGIAAQVQDIPQGRFAAAWECAALAAFLAGSGSDCFAGQAFPFAGGWTG
ncbi:MAG: SDR family oxidoreductase [Aestuariivirga sp.]|uniref:SDR family oxidoreductase n=1 Tax=Aestuariivirga sp. TaxID=2650926 RepID=UPI0038D19066